MHAPRPLSRSIAVLFASTLFPFAAAQAQTAEERLNTPANEAVAPVTLDEVVVTAGVEEEQGYIAPTAVTATKTEARRLETPQNIQVVTRELMEDQGATTIDDALRNVAGVFPGGYYPGYDYYRIRGFDATGFTFKDGLFADHPAGSFFFSEEVYGLERVEVLKGPASMLYGQSSLGGLVNLVTKAPTKESFFDTRLSGGSYDFFEAGTDFGGALNESGTIYGRMTTMFRHRGTFTDDVDPAKRLYVAPALTIELGPDTILRLRGEYLYDWTVTPFPLPAAGTAISNPNGDLPISRNVGEPGFQNKGDYRRGQIGYQLEHRFTPELTLRQSVRGAMNQTIYQAIYPSFLDADGRTLYRYPLSYASDYFTLGADTSLEAKFNTWALNHTALAGIDFSYVQDDSRGAFGSIDPLDLYSPRYGAKASPLSVYTSAETTSTATGLYLQDHIKYDRLTVILGGRADFVDTEVRDTLAFTENSGADSAFSPRFGLTYEFLPGASVYGSYSRSFRSQSSYRSFDGSLLKPEEGENIEVGLKTELFDGRLTSTLAFYQLTRENVATADFASPGFYLVAGEQRSRGLELDATVRITPSWSVVAAYSYINAEITADTEIPIGSRPINIPEHGMSAWSQYTIQSGTFKGLGFGVGGRYYSSQEGDRLNTFNLPAYGVVDLAVSYERERFRAQVNVTNLLDREYAGGSYSAEYVLPGQPLMVRGTVELRF